MKKAVKIESKSLADTAAAAKKFLNDLEPGKRATVIALYGDLGAGKTAFVKEAAKILGVREDITSPTFVIEKIYKLSFGLFANLIHIDAYRLESADELLHLGWQSIVENPQNLILLEWPEKVAPLVPANAIPVRFTFVNETSRTIEM